MENQDSNQSIFGFSFDETVKQSLHKCATWAGYAAIVSIIASGLDFIEYFVTRSRIEQYSRGFRSEPEAGGGLLGAFIALGLGIAFFIFQTNFAAKTKSGITGNSQEMINQGLRNLYIYLRLFGVVIIIVMAFVLLVLLIGLGGGFS